MLNVGIIGQGFVGGTIGNVFRKYYNVETFDKFLKDRSSCDSLEQLCERCKIIFLCVPTPMNHNGSCNTDIVETVLGQINNINKVNNIIIIKSTIPPSSTKKYNEQYKNIDIVFNPEFLTEANALKDFINQNRIILGGEPEILKQIEEMYLKVFPNADYVLTDSTTAEFVKYVTNIFLAVKVSFANEIKQIADKLNINYDELIEYVKLDKRIGKTHLSVPGPDGKSGFSGSCFPKDIRALIYLANNLGIDTNTISGAWQTNLTIRPEQDWLNLKGRSIVNKDCNDMVVIIGNINDDFLVNIQNKHQNRTIMVINNKVNNNKVNNNKVNNNIIYVDGNVWQINELLVGLDGLVKHIYYFKDIVTNNNYGINMVDEDNIQDMKFVIDYCNIHNCKLTYCHN